MIKLGSGPTAVGQIFRMSKPAAPEAKAPAFAALWGWLPGAYGVAFQVKVDEDNVPAPAEEREALWRRIAAAEFLSASEKRQLLGLPKVAED